MVSIEHTVVFKGNLYKAAVSIESILATAISGYLSTDLLVVLFSITHFRFDIIITPPCIHIVLLRRVICNNVNTYHRALRTLVKQPRYSRSLQDRYNWFVLKVVQKSFTLSQLNQKTFKCYSI